MHRIVFIGKMASGKSFAASMLQKKYPKIKKLSFATPVKEIAMEHFSMTNKDRKLLQIIGTTGRAIDENVWVNILLSKIHEGKSYVIDDARFLNECTSLRKKGFSIVYLKVDRDTRIQRLKDLYKEDAKNHIDNMDDNSENQLRPEDADFVWEVKTEEQLYEKIDLLDMIERVYC